MNALTRIQPAIAERCQPLCEGFEHDGLMLDLYGDYDKSDGSYWVQDVTLAGSDVSLAAVLEPKLMRDWSERLGDLDMRR